MNRRVRLLFLLFLLQFLSVGSVALRAQDSQFSQFFANPIYMSPSYTGASLGHRAILSYRDQWSMIPNMYRTLSFSYDINVASLRSGFGVFVLGDMAGDARLGTINIGLTYAYSVEMTPEWSFRPGIGFYFIQHLVDYSRFIWGDQILTDPPATSTMQTLGKPYVNDIDVTASILFHSSNAWVGFTYDHILRPKSTFYGEGARTPFKFTLFGGYRFVLSSLYRRGVDQSISVAANLRNQGKAWQLDIGGYWFKYPLLVGAWYRGLPFVKQYGGSDAIILMLGCRFDRFQVVYSYDLTVSRLGVGSGGSHELSLTYEAKIKPKKRKYRAPVCPPF